METTIRKDQWSATEDEVLRNAIKKYGSNQWNRVASLLSRKSAAQCKSRWFEVLKPSISHDEWTHEEDILLLELSRRMPNMWRSISATLGSRSAGQCHERYEYLIKHEKVALANRPGGETEEIEDEAQARELKAEANARLANTLGRKAKRKQRERIEDEAKFIDLIRQNRELKRPKLNSPQVKPPGTETGISTQTPLQHTIRQKKHETRALELSEPVHKHEITPKYHHIQLTPAVSKKLATVLNNIPPPKEAK